MVPPLSGYFHILHRSVRAVGVYGLSLPVVGRNDRVVYDPVVRSRYPRLCDLPVSGHQRALPSGELFIIIIN